MRSKCTSIAVAAALCAIALLLTPSLAVEAQPNLYGNNVNSEKAQSENNKDFDNMRKFSAVDQALFQFVYGAIAVLFVAFLLQAISTIFLLILVVLADLILLVGIADYIVTVTEGYEAPLVMWFFVAAAMIVAIIVLLAAILAHMETAKARQRCFG